MPLYYDEFSDLQIDWPMILVGWRGFVHRKLSAEQVVAYALEQVGKGTAEQDEIAALLASTDSQDWQTIDRYLEQIVGEHFSREIALRKWRLAEFKKLLKTILPYTGTSDDEHESVYTTFMFFWNDWHDLSADETIWPGRLRTREQILADQQVWAEREQMALRGEREEHQNEHFRD